MIERTIDSEILETRNEIHNLFAQMIICVTKVNTIQIIDGSHTSYTPYDYQNNIPVFTPGNH